MKKLNIVIIVVTFIVFINKIYASQDIDILLYSNANMLNENDSIQIKVDLNNIDKQLKIKCISAYLYADKSVFDELSNENILINGKYINNCFDKNYKKIYTYNNFKLGNNSNLLTINLNVKENVKADSGYFEIKQLYLIDENNKKIDFADKSIKFSLSNMDTNCTNKLVNINNVANINSKSNIGSVISNSIPKMKNLDKFENIFNVPIISNIPKLFAVPFEGMWIITYSFIIVIGFRICVTILYKTFIRLQRKYRQINQIKRMDKIFRNINTKIVD